MCYSPILKQEWTKLAQERGIDKCGSKIIVDNVFLFGPKMESVLAFFRVVIEVSYQHYRATIKLRKCKFFNTEPTEFIGIDVAPEGNSPASSNFKAFKQLTPPQTFTELIMVIRMYGFFWNVRVLSDVAIPL